MFLNNKLIIRHTLLYSGNYYPESESQTLPLVSFFHFLLPFSLINTSMLISVWTLRAHFCLYLFSQTRSRKVEHWLWFISWKSSCCLCLLGFCLLFCTVTSQFSGFSCVVGRILRWPFGGKKRWPFQWPSFLNNLLPLSVGGSCEYDELIILVIILRYYEKIM